MKKLLGFGLLFTSTVFVQDTLGQQLTWSQPLFIEGTGVTNCNDARIENDAWARCKDWAEARSSNDVHFVIKDVQYYNPEIEQNEGAPWDRKRSCKYRANIKCGYQKFGQIK